MIGDKIIMHNYNKLEVPSKIIYFILVFVSIIISIAIAHYLKQISANGFRGYITLIWAGSPLATYGMLFWFFDNFFWRFPIINKLINIPNLNGTYEGKLKSSYDNFKNTVNFTLTIKQTFNKIVVKLKTGTSESESLSAFLKREGTTALLVYNYHNEPTTVEKATLNEHKGTAWLKFDLVKNTFEGRYYTDKRPLNIDKAICNYGKLEGIKRI